MKLIGTWQKSGLPVQDNSYVRWENQLIWATLQYMKDMTGLSYLDMYGVMENGFSVPKGDTTAPQWHPVTATPAPSRMCIHTHIGPSTQVRPVGKGIYLLYGGIYLLYGGIYLLYGGIYL
jgi:hypothetical protein